MLDVPVAETVRAKSVRVAWTQCSLSVSVDGEEVVGGPLSAAIRVDDDRCASPSLPPSRPPVACAAGLSFAGGVARRSDTTWQMSSGEDGRRVVQVTMQKAGYGLWERCFADEIPQHEHEKASEYRCLRRHCPA